MLSQLFAADDFSRRHFQMHFFLGALRVKPNEIVTYQFDHSISVLRVVLGAIFSFLFEFN